MFHRLRLSIRVTGGHLLNPVKQAPRSTSVNHKALVAKRQTSWRSDNFSKYYWATRLGCEPMSSILLIILNALFFFSKGFKFRYFTSATTVITISWYPSIWRLSSPWFTQCQHSQLHKGTVAFTKAGQLCCEGLAFRWHRCVGCLDRSVTVISLTQYNLNGCYGPLQVYNAHF